MALAVEGEVGVGVGEAPPPRAGPLSPGEASSFLSPPFIQLPRAVQVLRLNQRQIEFVFRARRELGEVFRTRGVIAGGPVVTCHPDHVRPLFKAPELALSITGESPVRPVVGPDSVLTANGESNMRQRKLVLPQFHGDAINGYMDMITRVTEQAIERWPTGRPLALAPRMQTITLDVIMAGIFGIDGRPERGTPEAWLRETVRGLVRASTLQVAQVAELMNVGHDEPVGFTKVGLDILDKPTYAVIRARRRATDLEDRRDVLSLLINARTEDGEALSDKELRNELLTLVLAGHETTANQLAWTWERLVRAPQAYDRLTAAVREDADAAEVVEQTIQESMRSRPVVPMIGRRVTVPWRLGEYRVDAGTPITMSILLLH